MLHRAGRITASKCYDVCHTATEKISSPALLATIMQYSETKSNNIPDMEMTMSLQQENLLLKLRMDIMTI